MIDLFFWFNTSTFDLLWIEFHGFFFYVWCLRSNDSGYKFKKLTRVDIFFCFFTCFLFLFHRSILVYIYIYKDDFMVFLFYFFLLGSQSKTWAVDLVDWPGLTHILLSKLHVYHANSDWFRLIFFLFFLSNFIIPYLIGWKLNYIIFLLLEKRSFPKLSWSLFFLSVCCCCLFFI
jgi:hypothetical protein